MMRYYRLYITIGGMPEAVQKYIDTHDLRKVDVIIQKEGKVIPIEVKSSNASANFLKAIMQNKPNITFSYKFIDGNIGVSNDGIITLPLYMIAFI